MLSKPESESANFPNSFSNLILLPVVGNVQRKPFSGQRLYFFPSFGYIFQEPGAEVHKNDAAGEAAEKINQAGRPGMAEDFP